ncbi:MAG: hypothetical protein K2N73_13935 [Lachnospiraceae bacterium]|nr:hypothetical protein [Lachnospiraceae bacterium]
MYTISNIIADIDRGCLANNMIENRFSYRIIFFVNENGKGTKHYIDTSYDDLRKTLENIIREYLSVTNNIVLAETTALKNGKCVSLLSRSYAFSLEEYFHQIYGRCKSDSENRNITYGRYAYQ